MDEKSKRYLSWHFHDFYCVDWQYDNSENRLTLTIREDWMGRENSDGFRLSFEGICYYGMEAEESHPNPPLFWIISTAFIEDSPLRKRLEKEYVAKMHLEDEPIEPFLHYEMELDHGWVEIICRDIRAERLIENPPPYIPEHPWIPPKRPEPFPAEEREARILQAAQNTKYPFKDFERAEETLLQMGENNDPALLPIVRKILEMDEPNYWDIAVRLLGQVGTAEDLPLLYAHIPRTHSFPYRRRLLLNSIDLLAEKRGKHL